ncbi:hypothetical protein RRG08_039203 [Elysia crispata]|uniref:Uncharacterized protein n=1 Tax=Elysia crispata TaxID=231223 RepID=A0AAE1E471_9GAST|nr:hypothetical protein RRG08_039203 [Elysia crispata]
MVFASEDRITNIMHLVEPLQNVQPQTYWPTKFGRVGQINLATFQYLSAGMIELVPDWLQQEPKSSFNYYLVGKLGCSVQFL